MTEERLHALDGLRAFAMLLGVVLHAAASFVIAPIPWLVRDVSRNVGFDVLLAVIHGFRMQVFFFLAGFFAHLLWRRLGTRGFLRQRAERIGVPFVVGMVTIVPVMIVLWIWAVPPDSPEAMRLQPLERHDLAAYPTAHLWFLEMLLILYAGAMLVAWAGARVAPRLPALLDAAFDWVMRRWWKPLLLVPPTVLCLWNGPLFGEVEEMGWSVFFAPRSVAYFGLFFAFGWWLHRRLGQLETLRRWVKTYFGLAVLAFFTWGACHAAQLKPGESGFIAVKLVALSGAALYAWAMTFALSGWFLCFTNRDRPWMRYLADASYWLYLMHVPLVMWLQVMVAEAPLNGWLKLAFILAGTLAVLLPAYRWGVRYTPIGRVLNGPRK